MYDSSNKNHIRSNKLSLHIRAQIFVVITIVVLKRAIQAILQRFPGDFFRHLSSCIRTARNKRTLLKRSLAEFFCRACLRCIHQAERDIELRLKHFLRTPCHIRSQKRRIVTQCVYEIRSSRL